MQRHLQQVAKLEAIRLFAGGIVHDFSNILGAILGYGEIAQSHLSEGSPARRSLDQVMRAGARGKELVERILAFSRTGWTSACPCTSSPFSRRHWSCSQRPCRRRAPREATQGG
jgi:hypothetical protein